jgi:hypothetical protein
MATRHATGRIRLARDSEQWAFDRFVKDTGRVFHFQRDNRGPLPPSVRNHAMISKHLGRTARRLELLASEELEAGHLVTALDLYFEASSTYGAAQHPIFAINDEKRMLHDASLRTFEKVRELAQYEIVHIDVPWENAAVAGNLHLVPGDEPRPCVFFIPGCDMTKEMYPHPHWNHGLQRGMHVFSFDGPGQGEGNLRDIALTSTNYEQAASKAIGELLERPDVSDVLIYATSFGSYWGVRLAATDDRVKACAAPWASYCDKYYLMNEESPRYRQLFAHLTRATSEEQLDEIVAGMDNIDDMAKIKCPTLLMSGEFDPRSPINDVYERFDLLTVPAELWVYADQHHMLSLLGNPDAALWFNETHSLTMDWLADRAADRPMPNAGEVIYLEQTGGGPNGQSAARKRWWYED